MIARSLMSTGRSFVTGCGSNEKLISLNALEVLEEGIDVVDFSEFIYTFTLDFALLDLILLDYH